MRSGESCCPLWCKPVDCSVRFLLIEVDDHVRFVATGCAFPGFFLFFDGSPFFFHVNQFTRDDHLRFISTVGTAANFSFLRHFPFSSCQEPRLQKKVLGMTTFNNHKYYNNLFSKSNWNFPRGRHGRFPGDQCFPIPRKLPGRFQFLLLGLRIFFLRILTKHR